MWWRILTTKVTLLDLTFHFFQVSWMTAAALSHLFTFLRTSHDRTTAESMNHFNTMCVHLKCLAAVFQNRGDFLFLIVNQICFMDCQHPSRYTHARPATSFWPESEVRTSRHKKWEQGDTHLVILFCVTLFFFFFFSYPDGACLFCVTWWGL